MVNKTIDIALEPLELRKNNPYYNGYIFVLPDGEMTLERETFKYTKSDRDKYYTVVQGDTLWTIAHNAYNDSKNWAIIADANSIENPFELTIGVALLIPDLNIHDITNL